VLTTRGYIAADPRAIEQEALRDGSMASTALKFTSKGTLWEATDFDPWPVAGRQRLRFWHSLLWPPVRPALAQIQHLLHHRHVMRLTVLQRRVRALRQTRRAFRNKPGRDRGYTWYDKMAEALGCYAEYVEEPEGIRPALQRAWKKVEESMVGFVNVKTDYRARATTVRFPTRET
jgi:hypothetical protein